MMTFHLDPNTTPADLSDLTRKLDRLANTVKYQQGTATLTIDNFSPQAQRAIEDLVMPYLPLDDAPIDWSKLAALAAKRKLQSAI